MLQTITLFSIVNDMNLIYAREYNLLENQLRGPIRLLGLRVIWYELQFRSSLKEETNRRSVEFIFYSEISMTFISAQSVTNYNS